MADGSFTGMVLSNIVLTGVAPETGGAPRCVKCAGGSYSLTGAQPSCQLANPGHYAVAGSSSPACAPSTFSDAYGASKCLTCGAGTLSGPGAVDCLNTCAFKFTDGRGLSYRYSLDTIEATGSHVTVRDRVRDTLLFLSPCQRMDAPFPCTSTASARGSYACARLAGRGRHAATTEFGRIISYAVANESAGVHDVSPDTSTIGYFDAIEPLPAVSRDPSLANGFIMRLTGSPCPARDGALYTLKIQFVCSLAAGLGQPILLPAPDECTLSVQWQSRDGCRDCDENDYVELVSACVGGEQRISYTPATACKDLGRPSLVRRCSSSSVSYVSLYAAIAVLGAALIGLGVVALRHRRAVFKYSQLVNAVGPQPARLDADAAFDLHLREAAERQAAPSEDDDAAKRSGGSADDEVSLVRPQRSGAAALNAGAGLPPAPASAAVPAIAAPPLAAGTAPVSATVPAIAAPPAATSASAHDVL